jgi:hypothetical protein
MKNFEKEYETLRQELNENKKYIFERPLVIITAAFVIFGYASDQDFIMLFPPVIIFLLLFNLKFTSNRLNSSARIVAYISLFIEKRNSENFQWESFLSEYRLRVKDNDTKNEKDNEEGLRYYPLIYWFHIISALLFIVLHVVLYLKNPIDFKEMLSFHNMITGISLLLCLIGLIFIIIIGWSTRTEKAQQFFSEETKNVKEIIAKMETEQLKSSKKKT